MYNNSSQLYRFPNLATSASYRKCKKTISRVRRKHRGIAPGTQTNFNGLRAFGEYLQKNPNALSYTEYGVEHSITAHTLFRGNVPHIIFYDKNLVNRFTDNNEIY